MTDLIIVNGDIRTMDPLQPRVTALAARGKRVVALGDDAEIRALATPSTRVIDAGGRLVLPGFQDTHIHLQESGTRHAFDLDLQGVRSLEISSESSQHLRRSIPTARAQGPRWYTGIFNDRNLTRQVLDEAVPDRPLFLSHPTTTPPSTREPARRSGSTPACRIPTTAISRAMRSASRQACSTKRLWSSRRHRMPETTDGEWEDGVRWGQHHANRHGFTGVLDALVTERHLRVYNALDRRGELSVRVASTALVEPSDSVNGALDRLEDFRRSYRSEMLKVHSAKFFLDGVFENRTAAMIDGYKDEIGGNAPVMFGENHLRELFIAMDAARFQIHVHVIGDKAARAALDGLEAAREINGEWPSLHQLAHVQLVRPRTFRASASSA